MISINSYVIIGALRISDQQKDRLKSKHFQTVKQRERRTQHSTLSNSNSHIITNNYEKTCLVKTIICCIDYYGVVCRKTNQLFYYSSS